YVLLGKLWTVLLPAGSIAWRMSLFSAACAAAACGVLYALARRGPLDPPAAARVAALLAAFAPSFWGEANIQRVYSLEALFVVLAGDYLRSLGTELAWAGSVLALIGVLAARRRGWPVLLPLLVMAGNLAAVAAHGSRSDIFIWHRYYIPSYLMAALLAGFGCQ